MKKIFIFCTLISFYCVNAQNITMAKAFYKKAQLAYENKDYKETISLLEKTKENLNGDTNPDIIYLEAKSRYKHDLNINKTKSLFNEFIEKADSSDGRIEEISSILADIETSSNYYSNGNAKTYYSKNESGEPYKKFYTEKGFNYKVITYDENNNVSNKGYFQNYNGSKVKKRVFGYLENKIIVLEYNNAGLITTRDIYNENATEILMIKEITFKNDIEQYEINGISGKPLESTLYHQGKPRHIIEYNENSGIEDFTIIGKYNNSEDFKIVQLISRESYKYSKISILDEFSSGFAKVIEHVIGPEHPWWFTHKYYYLDNTGYLFREEYKKNGKLKKVYVYNKNDDSMTELKKKDW